LKVRNITNTDKDRTPKWARPSLWNATAFGLILLFLHVLAVARYDTDTTLAILRSLDLSALPQFVLGTAASLWPYVIVLVGIGGILLLAESLKGDVVDAVDLAVSTVLLIVAYWRGSWLLRIFLSVLAATIFVTRRPRRYPRVRFKDPNNPTRKERMLFSIEDFVRSAVEYVGMIVVLALMGILLAAALSSTPWVPAEQVSSTDFSGRAYVFGSSEDWTTLVGYSDRQARLVRTSSITFRTVCAPIDRSSYLFSKPELKLRTVSSSGRSRYDACL
jgi:hypothetical protein